MAFPFVAPIDPWIVDVLKARSNNKHLTTFKNPYAILVSTAKVIKSVAKDTSNERITQLKDYISNADSTNVYNGCILANTGNTNIQNHLEAKYSSDKTNIGVDFSGKLITVDGESGRMIPQPMIESIDIDTDGSNNTLKVARINVRCFTLKQLELFELFYMKPSMGVLLEFGDSSLMNPELLSNKNTNPNQPQSNKTSKINYYKNGEIADASPFNTVSECFFYNGHGTFEEFCRAFTKIHQVSTDSNNLYNETVAKSFGSYDRVAGYIMDYGFTIEPEGTYLANLELTQANQFSLAIPMSGGKGSSSTITPDNKLSNINKIKNKIIHDFKLDSDKLNNLMSKHPLGRSWENDFFNFFINTDSNKDSVINKEQYVSLRFILSILVNYNNISSTDSNSKNENFFKFNLPTYKVDGKDKKIIPVQSNKYMISSNDVLIYPTNELPDFTPKSKLSDTINDSIAVAKSTIDGTINGYNFHIKGVETVIDIDTNIDLKTSETANKNYRLGDACNIFIKYQTVFEMWNDSAYKIDFINKILTLINKNSYGMIGLELASQIEGSSSTIIDYKLIESPYRTSQDKPEIYRFPVGSVNSNVKTFSFNYEMSDLVAASTLFDAQNFLKKLKEDAAYYSKSFRDEKILQKVDFSTFANSDGYYSINFSEYLKLTEIIEDDISKEKNGLTTPSDADKSTDKSELTKKSIFDVIEGKQIKFKLKPSSKLHIPLIYEDEEFVNTIVNKSKEGIDIYTGQFTSSDKNQAPTLTNIDVTLTIDGMSGLRCGQCFRVSGIPEIYNQIGVFQITNIKHSITKDTGWETTIEASYTIRNFN